LLYILKNFDIFIDVFHDWNEMFLNSTNYNIELYVIIMNAPVLSDAFT